MFLRINCNLTSFDRLRVLAPLLARALFLGCTVSRHDFKINKHPALSLWEYQPKGKIELYDFIECFVKFKNIIK